MTNHPFGSGGASPVAGSEEDAFAELYQEHIHAVFNYCLYQVGDAVVAEDLTADIFERAWRARRRYNPRRAKFSTWLFTIARRRAIDWQRRRGRRRTVGLDEQLPSPQSDPDTLTLEAEDQHRLHRLIQNLPYEAQELLAMKFGAGMTNREIAEVLEKSETAIGSALYRLVRKLRLQWEEGRDPREQPPDRMWK
ncbi:MAG: sigma-70 family RNA polymerase sigma factor [Chloroflexi bacterium]|nr:sigma-70 family RNA polymerase sigma factor [Chloroflexota bacterium]